MESIRDAIWWQAAEEAADKVLAENAGRRRAERAIVAWKSWAKDNDARTFPGLIAIARINGDWYQARPDPDASAVAVRKLCVVEG